MKMPEPVAWMYTKNGFCDVSNRCWEPWEVDEGFREQRLYTEAQLREALASNEAVMRMALGALKHGKPMFDAYWGGIEFDDAIEALEEQLK